MPEAASEAMPHVHVWSAVLSGMPEALGELLSEQERERAGRMLDQAGRARWTAARGLLRALLGEWVGADPASLRFEVGRHGKPSIGSSPVCFSVSHSGDLALYAICEGSEVGVDVEVASRRTHRRRDDVAIARRVLGEGVAERLASLPERERSIEFLKAWVAHEARVKCLGVGIGHAMADGGGGPGAASGGVSTGAGVSMGAGVSASRGVSTGAGAHARAGEGRAREPWVCELEVDGGAFAALAVERGPAEVVRREWVVPVLDG